MSRDCQVIALDHLPDDIVDLTLCQRFASGIWKQRWGIIIDAQLLPKGSESLEVTPALDWPCDASGFSALLCCGHFVAGNLKLQESPSSWTQNSNSSAPATSISLHIKMHATMSSAVVSIGHAMFVKFSCRGHVTFERLIGSDLANYPWPDAVLECLVQLLTPVVSLADMVSFKRRHSSWSSRSFQPEHGRHRFECDGSKGVCLIQPLNNSMWNLSHVRNSARYLGGRSIHPSEAFPSQPSGSRVLLPQLTREMHLPLLQF